MCWRDSKGAGVRGAQRVRNEWWAIGKEIRELTKGEGSPPGWGECLHSAFSLRSGEPLQGLGLRGDRTTFPFWINHGGWCIENRLWRIEARVGAGRPVRRLTQKFRSEMVVAWTRAWQCSGERYHHTHLLSNSPGLRVLTDSNCLAGEQDLSHFPGLCTLIVITISHL